MAIKMGQNKCKYCNKALTKENLTFCGRKCRQNWDYKNNPKINERIKKNMKKRYEKIKNNPEYKEKRKIKVKKWINEHKERWKEKNRVINRKFGIKIRKERREMDLCGNCGREIIPKFRITKKGDVVYYKTCRKCREKINERYHRRKHLNSITTTNIHGN